MGEYEQTVVDLIEEAIARCDARRQNNPGAPAREFAIAITALEDARMRFTRGLAMVQGCFNPVDLEAPDA